METRSEHFTTITEDNTVPLFMFTSISQVVLHIPVNYNESSCHYNMYKNPRR